MAIPADLLTPPDTAKKLMSTVTANEDQGEEYSIAEARMPILTTVEPEIEDPDLPYNHEKWDPWYREANNLKPRNGLTNVKLSVTLVGVRRKTYCYQESNQT